MYPILKETYQLLSNKTGYSTAYIAKTAANLWRKLSDILKTKVNKANIKSTIDKIYKSNIAQTNNGFQINKINLCSNTPNNLSNTPDNNHQRNKKKKNNQAKFKEDLTQIPPQNLFYGRSEELTSVSQQILEQKSRLVSILGVSGIGKTAFTIELIKQIKTNFNYVIYFSLKTLPNLTSITENIIKFISPKSEKNLNINTLKKYLSHHRCLIILDDVQTIFSKGKLAGVYQSGYENYKDLFEIMTQFTHKSCLILVSQELPLELVNLADNNLYYSSLLLTSLGESAKGILQEKQLLNEEKWDNLIEIYEGNPHYLKIVANLIQNFFDGNVTEFLAENESIIPLKIQNKLHFLLSKLSPIEQEIVLILSKFEQPISRQELKTNLDSSSSNFIAGLESLQNRYLMTKIKQNKTKFKLSRIFQEYVKICYLN